MFVTKKTPLKILLANDNLNNATKITFSDELPNLVVKTLLLKAKVSVAMLGIKGKTWSLTCQGQSVEC
jgi:hypothetical protein